MNCCKFIDECFDDALSSTTITLNYIVFFIESLSAGAYIPSFPILQHDFLSKRVKILDSQKKLIYKPTNSFYQVLSADANNKHGFNVHGCIIDELHCQPDDRLFNVLTKGAGDARRQSLTFLITTAGDNLHSVCYQQHQTFTESEVEEESGPSTQYFRTQGFLFSLVGPLPITT